MPGYEYVDFGGRRNYNKENMNIRGYIMGFVYVIIGIAVLTLITVLANLRVVPQATEFVVELLGKYRTTWKAGLHCKIPFF